MTGLVRKATLFAACGVLVASAAMAGVPSPGNSTIPTRINLVGFDFASSTADGAAGNATQTVTVRDLANNPIANSSVVLDFSGCTSDVRLGDGTAQLFPGVSINCGGHTARALTNGSGVATMVLIGGGNSAVLSHAAGCAKVYADGVLLGSIGVGMYDEDGASGVAGADLSLWKFDFVNHPATSDRSDYDGAGGVAGADLSLWVGVFVNGKSNTSAATYCVP